MNRDRLEVYLGRATVSTLSRRWSSHAEKRRHQYGCVLFTCDPDRVERLEDVAVKILAQLKKGRALCVRNANKWDGNLGGEPKPELALVYMTWKIVASEETWIEPNLDDVRWIAKKVSDESKYDVTKDQIENGLSVVTRISEYDPLHWWEP